MGLLARFGHAFKAPFLKCGRLYNATAQKSPMCTGLVTTVVKTSAADMFAQKVMESRDEMDWRRHAMFCSFGLVYLGCFQYYLYNTLFVRWCSGITAVVGHKGSAPIKTFIDQALHHPFVYFPSFYILKGAVEGRTLDSSITKYRADLWENCKALWLIWVPAQLVNFSFVPRHLRIPFVAGISFAWTVVISCMRGTLESSHATSAAGQSAELASATAGDLTETAGFATTTASATEQATATAGVNSDSAARSAPHRDFTMTGDGSGSQGSGFDLATAAPSVLSSWAQTEADGR